MKPLILALCVVFAFSGLSAQTPAWQPSAGHTQVPIWPGAVSDAQLVAGPEVFANWTDRDFLVAGRPVAGKERLYPAVDAADKESYRPDFGVAVYPGHMLENL